MKPIHLRLAGLHSFREQQEVDFLSLCQGGVFGIFGPTGSGKSSLLDAITLALYGRVERAANQIQGILNHAEDELMVSYTFQLGEETYRVERTLKRSGELTVRTAVCRLLKVEEEIIVLADKINEVNQRIQELLGLTIDDFTRAVVLPQGKFAEFLSLKGIERRQMLQRLFHLERYGDQLNERLRDRSNRIQELLGKLIAEQQGLGDASKQALVAAQQRVTVSAELVKELEARKRGIEQTFDRKKELWIWQEELHKVQEQLQQVQQEQEKIEQLQERLQQAEQAQTLEPYLLEWESAGEEVRTCLVAEQESLEKVTKAQEVEGRESSAYQLAQQEREEKEPFWIERQAQLKQAQELQIEVHQLVHDQQALQSTIDNERKKAELLQTVITQLTAEWKSKEQIYKEEKERLRSLAISVQEREQLLQAHTSFLTIMNLQALQEEVESEYQQKKSDWLQTERAQQVHKELKKQIREQVQSWMETVAQLYAQYILEESRVAQYSTLSQEERQQVQVEIDRQKERNLASQLAHTLRAGEACPVCGSVDHPQPLTGEKHGSVDQLEQQKAHVEEKLDKLKQLEQYLLTRKEELQTRYTTMQELFASEEQLSCTPLLSYAADVSATVDYQVEQQEALRLGSLEKLLHNCKELHQHLLRSQEQAKEIEGLQWQAHTQEVELQYKLEEIRVAGQKLGHKLGERQLAVQQKVEEWHGRFPTYNLQNIEEEQQRLAEKDRLAEQLDQHITSLEQELHQLQQQKQGKEEQLQKIQLQLTQFATILEQKNELLNKKQTALQEQIGAEDVDQLLQEAQLELSKLRVQSEETLKSWKSSQEKLQVEEKELVTAKEALRQAQQRHVKATSVWQKFLTESAFSSKEEIQQALVDIEEQKKWKASITLFQEQVAKWSQEVDRLQALIADEQLTEEEWLSIKLEKEEIGQAWNNSLQEHGAALQAYKEIENKHERFSTLEQQKQEAEQVAERLDKLRHVFRGNSFVEFIAQEQLMQICRAASERLGRLTRQRYALEVDSAGGFVIRDDANGGVRRPVSTLSGGETFLTSLALALALSTQIQLRGKYPLQFFFLDEGFGTLDQDVLETVISSLEQLQSDHLSVGVISHVPELHARLPRRLMVEPAEPGGRGSRVRLETF